MKNNLIYLYLVYIIVVYLLFIIDISILIYYIFWINNVFINPLIWLFVKILYYNRTIILLLIFYYFIAKFTIKELGYKYFYFFNIDVRKWRSLYLSYIWSITIYHIEIISILLFFIIIILPLALYNKEIFFLICCIIMLLVIWWRLLRNRLKYMKEKKIRLKNLIFFILINIFFFKIFNYQFIKEFYTTYIFLDKWVFELLEWKIQMYNKVIERDIYSDTIGLKPVWVGEKLNKKETIDFKLWDILCKKKKNYLLKELKYKLKKTKYKYYLYKKYYEKVVYVKNNQVLKKIEKLRKEYFLKNVKILSKKPLIIKEFSPKIDITNENPLITQEKEKERLLHRTIISHIIQKFSLKDYYRLNFLLNDLTLKSLYFQPFFDKKGVEKQLYEDRRSYFYLYIKENISLKEELKLFKLIINKIKKNELFIKNLKNELLIPAYKKYNENKFFLENLFKYLIIKEEKKKIINKFFKFNKEKDDSNIKNFFKKLKKNISYKNKINKLFYFKNAKNSIIENEKLKEKKNICCTFPTYIEKDELEKIDYKVLFNTVKKYNEEETKANWKNEFSDFFILKEKKEKLTMPEGPNLSNRNKK